MMVRLFQSKLGWLGWYTVAYLAFLYTPSLLLPLFSINDSVYVTFPLKGVTFRWYGALADSPALLQAFRNSLKVGLGAAITSTILGTMAALAFTRCRVAFKGFFAGLISVPLVVPLVILGISLVIVLNKIGVPLSLKTVTFAHVVIGVPYAMAIMMARFEGLDASIEEASLDLGETPWMTFWRVTFPLALPALVSSLLMTFVISFDEFLLAFFMASDQVTLPVYMWGQLRFPNQLPIVLALGSAILIVSFIVVTLAQVLRARGGGLQNGA